MLYLWMPEANGKWQWTDGDFWNTALSMEQLVQETQSYHGNDVVVFFPSRHAQIMELSMPKQQYKKMGQEGIKYLLEEYVVLPIDSMKVLHHFEQPDQLSILGIANTMLETFQHALHLLPFKVEALLPDFLILQIPCGLHAHCIALHPHHGIFQLIQSFLLCVSCLMHRPQCRSNACDKHKNCGQNDHPTFPCRELI